MMKMFIFILMFSSVILCTEAKSWWVYWILLEINSLAFIIYMIKEKKKEKIFVFLMFQTLSAVLMMMFIFTLKWSMDQSTSMMLHQMVLVSIIMKIGMFPFQNWLMKIMKNFSWVMVMMTFSWQKMIPLMVTMKVMEKTKHMMNAIMVSMIFLNTIMLKLSNIKIIMTISSLIHNTWMFIPLMVLKTISILYLISYTLILIPLSIIFMKMNIKNIEQQVFNKKTKKETMFTTMSISGIPPSITFLMMMSKKFMSMIILLISSCMSFYVYMQMFLKNFFLEKMETKKSFFLSKNEMKETSWLYIFLPIVMWM